MPEAEAPVLAPAYYATSARGWRRDVWALLHPPYTAWHLSYVLIGAGLAPVLKLQNLPLQTTIPSWVLWSSAVAGLALAVGLGLVGVAVLGPGLLPFIAAGVLFVFAYNLELLGGRLHGDFWFAISWGAFPVLTAFFAQTGRLSVGAVVAAAAAYALSFGQRALSTPARLVRRRAQSVIGTMTFADGTHAKVDEATLLRPLEVALRAFSWGVGLLGLGLVAAKLF
ncbi:MAG: hypothetical protein E6J08_01295 [Chloroflexi bacterium]|nr:MAG: hypothetical protein E6J08_01295 [Chloroflexota bacterium]